MLAGRDLLAGGTWLGVDRQRRFGVVTNFRELPASASGGSSRGRLIPDFLSSNESPQTSLAHLAPTARQFAGFNILFGDSDELWYASNRSPNFARRLEPGVYGLSNRLLDTPWPKLTRVRRRFEAWLGAVPVPPTGELLAMLEDRTQSTTGDDPYPADLPADWRQALSAPFVLHPVYGTRCSTVLILADDGDLQMTERRFDAAGDCSGETEFALHRAAWP
jgi:uncharacterized protein with NRDE domain